MNKVLNIIDIKELSKCYNLSKNLHWRYRKNIEIIPTKTIGCYFLFDKNKQIIYIGKSKISIRQRIISHLFSNISIYCWDSEIKSILQKREKTKFFSYIELLQDDIDITEINLIQKYKPILNRQFNN